MRYSVLSVLFLFLVVSVKGQDLIVNSNGDSVNCKITKVESGFIYYLDNSDGGFVKTVKPITWVQSYSYGYFASEKGYTKNPQKQNLFSLWRFSLGGGYSYQFAKSKKINGDVLRSGVHLNPDISYFYYEQIGIGLKGVYFNTSANSSIFNTSTGQSYSSSNDISIWYVGPALYTRYYTNNSRNFLSLNVSAGYLSYNNKVKSINSYTITGSNIATILELGYDFALAEKWSAYVKSSFFFSNLDKHTKSDETGSSTLYFDTSIQTNLSRFDLSAGVAFSIF